MHARLLVLIAGLVFSGFCGTLAVADPPSEWVVTYGIYEMPSDPDSPIAYIIRLSLQRAEINENSIGWAVAAVEIRQMAPDRSSISHWVENDPHVPTADGLWWVDHADSDAPRTDEFSLPPHLEGTAAAQDPNGTDLSYDFQGQPYTPPSAPATPPYDVTVSLDYSFMLVGAQQALLQRAEEPTEVNPPAGD